jgi:DNA repair protein RadC
MWLRKSRKEPVLSHISMKNLPESERPYERFQILGAEALSDAELLAIILKTGAKDYTALDLARDLLSECQGNLLNLYEIGYEQLLERRGIGPVKATQLKAIAELSKRIARTGRGYHLSMNCPSSIADYYMEELRHRREEAFMAAFFDSKCKFLGDSVIATGSICFPHGTVSQSTASKCCYDRYPAQSSEWRPNSKHRRQKAYRTDSGRRLGVGINPC